MFAAVPLAQGSPELVWKRNTKVMDEERIMANRIIYPRLNSF